MLAGRQTVLVTGGAGYIGSHTVLALRDAGIPAVVLDDLSTGNRNAVPSDVPMIEGDAGDEALVREVIAGYAVGAVIHFAGSVVVPESVARPLDYYRNNTATSRNLLEACVAGGVGVFVFSSTAAVYGTPQEVPIPEEAPTQPINPYGTSKLMTEWILRDTAAAHDLRYVALRYFNVAGADPALRSGENRPVATHLINVAAQAALGRREGLSIYGDDYDTPDGTCIRDYVHVSDLADAHLRVLEHLADGGASGAYNCGYGRGYSVREVVDAVEGELGRPLNVRVAERRPGDPPRLVADARRLRQDLGWRPRHDDLATIVRTALAWEEKLAQRKAEAREVAQ